MTFDCYLPDIWLTFLNLSDYQSVRLASFRLNHEVAILLNHRFDTANQGIEGFAGIRFLGPKSITNLLFGELMMRIMCVGHDTDLVGSNPTAGIYRQAKRTTSRCQ